MSNQPLGSGISPYDPMGSFHFKLHNDASMASACSYAWTSRRIRKTLQPHATSMLTYRSSPRLLITALSFNANVSETNLFLNFFFILSIFIIIIIIFFVNFIFFFFGATVKIIMTNFIPLREWESLRILC